MNVKRFSRELLWLFIDIFLLSLALYLSFWLRFDGEIPLRWLDLYPKFLVLILAIKLPLFWFGGLYRFSWGQISLYEILRFGILVMISQAIIGTFFFLAGKEILSRIGLIPLPRSVLVLDALLTFLLLGGARMGKRIYYALRFNWQRKPAHRRRVLLIGAGNAGAQVARLMRESGGNLYHLVGFLDDDPAKHNSRIQGAPVLGTREDLPRIVSQYNVDEIWITMPSAPSSVIKETVDLARKAGIKHLRILPHFSKLINGQLTLSDVRRVNIEDVLGREPVQIDLEQVKALLRDRTVLVTGATGSIGSELCRQILRFRPRALWALDIDESRLFFLEKELQEHVMEGSSLYPVIGDIRNRAKIEQIFSEAKPDVIFHAAAYKHVPLMEKHPEEAVKTNVRGTQIVAEAALKHGAEKFVLISTDKAVSPSSVMGATKRVAEHLILLLNERARRENKPTRFVAVRFGNVLGSRGSVFPIFEEQIRRGGPVTVTHPEMKRYFMLPEEAVFLVLQAAAMGKGGEVFVLDMGDPIKILDLAKEMIKLAGYEPDVDIPIVFTGMRPGEKLFEELLTAEEGTEASKHKKIWIARISPPENEEEFSKFLNSLFRAAKKGDGESIRHILRKLIPTYRNNNLHKFNE